MKRYITALAAITVLGAVGLSGCASISEDECQAGNWEALGYKDGTQGVRRDKIASYADRCSKYGIRLNPKEYLRGFEAGLPTYCTYERGFALGENGSSFNQVCSGDLAVDFAPGYNAGRAVYAVYQEHEDLIDDYNALINKIDGIEGRLATETDLSDEDRRRLRRKLRKFEADADEARIDVRVFERLHDLPKHRFD